LVTSIHCTIGYYLRREAEEDNDIYDGHRLLKLTAAQQRQINRDKRRRRRGDKRTTAQDRAERLRKDRQAKNRENARADPNYSGYGDEEFIRKREKFRQDDCDENGGWACGWRAIDRDPNAHGGYDYDRIHRRHYPDEPTENDNWYWDD